MADVHKDDFVQGRLEFPENEVIAEVEKTSAIKWPRDENEAAKLREEYNKQWGDRGRALRRRG